MPSFSYTAYWEHFAEMSSWTAFRFEDNILDQIYEEQVRSDFYYKDFIFVKRLTEMYTYIKKH